MSQPPNELFAASCGVFGRWTLSIAGEKKQVEERTFASAYALVGSHSKACLHLAHPTVSRRHAYLQAFPGGIFCVNLSDRFGMCLNGIDCRWGWLRTSQRVQIGPFTLELPTTNQAPWLASSSWLQTDPIAERAHENAPLASVVGTVSDGDKVVAEWRMNRVVVLVGRSRRCKVLVEHPSVSLQHCSLVRTPLGLWVIDLLSRTGTFLNGRPVRCARIGEGDRLQVGKYQLRFWYPEPKPKVVVPLATGGEASWPLPETNRALAVLARPRQTMLQRSQLPEPRHTVAETNTMPTVLAGNADNSVVLALAAQFSLLQQEMFRQFQESLLMASQLFASPHQDQMAAVQKDLADLRAIAVELRGLQNELNSNLATIQAAPAAAPANGEQRRPETGVHDPAPTAAENALPDAAPGTKAPVKEEPASGIPPLKTPSGEGDVHVWLTQRIASLEREQQSRWSKLLGMILGN